MVSVDKRNPNPMSADLSVRHASDRFSDMYVTARGLLESFLVEKIQTFEDLIVP